MISRKQRKILFAVLSVAWMMVIFFYSARNGYDSASDSDPIGVMIGQKFIMGYDQMNEGLKFDVTMDILTVVRKTAHALEYAILALLLAGATCNEFSVKELKKAWLYAVLYAFTDEFHQLFVPDRAGLLSDVVIDASGAALSMVVLYRLIKWLKGRGIYSKIERI